MSNLFMKILSDKNEINEKNFIGLIAFLVMVVFAISDIVTGFLGKHLIISDTIYNSFLILVLGAFSISGAEKIFKKPESGKDEQQS